MAGPIRARFMRGYADSPCAFENPRRSVIHTQSQQVALSILTIAVVRTNPGLSGRCTETENPDSKPCAPSKHSPAFRVDHRLLKSL